MSSYSEENVITVAKGENLIYEGEDSNELYYIQTGTLAVLKRKSSGEQQIGTIYSGEIVGEMSFIDNEPRSATVRALSDCIVIPIPREVFTRSQKSLPKLH